MSPKTGPTEPSPLRGFRTGNKLFFEFNFEHNQKEFTLTSKGPLEHGQLHLIHDHTGLRLDARRELFINSIHQLWRVILNLNGFVYPE